MIKQVLYKSKKNYNIQLQYIFVENISVGTNFLEFEFYL